jgi:hypothetical protein
MTQLGHLRESLTAQGVLALETPKVPFSLVSREPGTFEGIFGVRLARAS